MFFWSVVTRLSNKYRRITNEVESAVMMTRHSLEKKKNIGFSHRPFLGAVVSERLPPKLLGMTDKKFKEVAVTVAFIVVASLTSLFCKRDKKREKQYRNNCCLRQSYETESLGKLSSSSLVRLTIKRWRKLPNLEFE